MNAEIVDNKLIIGGYVYYHSKYASGGARRQWECVRLRAGECKTRAVTNNPVNGGQLVVIRGIAESPHSQHPPNFNECEAERVKYRLKRKAKSEPERRPSQLLRTELGSVSQGVLCQLPSRENLSKAVRRMRRKELPPNPTSLSGFDVLPEIYQRTLAEEKFLIFDSGLPEEDEEEEGRVLVFGTEQNLKLLNKSKIWFLDGTFKVSPTIFTQVFTILGTRERRRNVADQEIVPLPLVYALLSSKEQVQYENVLRAVKDAGRKYRIPNFGPAKIMTDFEKGILNACEEVFPTVPVFCCFFHFKQSLYRKIQSSGLQTAYNDANDETVRLQTHMTAALAYVPVDEVPRVFRLLQRHVTDELTDILQYVEEYYVIGRPGRGRRRAVAPRYKPALWNQYDAALAGDHKTNNLSEGWHNRFNVVVGKAHPDLYSALAEFQKEQAHTESMVAELSAGKRVKAAPQKKWVEVQNRLRRVVETYEEHVEDGTEIEYLSNLAQNIYL